MSKPNILLIMTDQQRADTIHALGNPVIATPALDRLVREGTAFTSAYAPAAECVPSRCCLTFGQYPGKTGCFGNGFPMPFETKETFMHALGRAGYYTHGIGKCHFTPEKRGAELNGFHSRERQEEIVSDPEQDEYLQFLKSNGGGHITDPQGVRGEMYYLPQPAQMPAELHPTQWVGDRSVQFLKDRAESEQPWFLLSSFIHPHPPFAPPAPWYKLYRDLDFPLPHTPDDCEKLLVRVNHNQNRFKRRDRGRDLQLIRTMRAYYHACISFVDFQVGRMLTALEESGRLENTLIIFTSDHGELLGDFRSFGKRSYHDAASRVPLILRGPGVRAGRRSTLPVSLVDIPSTILEVAGEKLETHEVDGGNLLQLADNPPEDRMVFSQLNRGPNGLYTALNKRWKYVFSAPDQRELLFDRIKDPGETTDLANTSWDSDWPSVVAHKAMRTALIQWLRDQGEEKALEGDELRIFPLQPLSGNPDASIGYQDHPWANHHLPGYSKLSTTES